MIAQRCFAALGNFSKMKYLKNLNKVKNQNIIEENKNAENKNENNNNGNQQNNNENNANNNNNNDNEKRINQIIVDAKLLLVKKRFEEAKQYNEKIQSPKMIIKS